jgi:hypothetical protein
VVPLRRDRGATGANLDDQRHAPPAKLGKPGASAAAAKAGKPDALGKLGGGRGRSG